MLTMFAEVYQDGEWHKVDKVFKSTHKELSDMLVDRVYDGTDENLIGFLKSQSWTGLPNDASEEIKAHKHFQNEANVYYISLNELMFLDWDIEVYKMGFISDWQHKRLKIKGIEPADIRKTAPFNAIAVSTFVADLIDKYPALNKDKKKVFVIYYYDMHPLCELVDFFCNVSMPALVDLIPEDGDVNDVRIVFSVRQYDIKRYGR